MEDLRPEVAALSGQKAAESQLGPGLTPYVATFLLYMLPMPSV